MDDYRVVYAAPDGSRWDLSSGAEGVLLVEDGISGLNSRRATEGLKLAGVPGQVVRRGGARIEPVTATLRVLLDPAAAGRDMAVLWPAWHRAWSFDEPGRVEYYHPAHQAPRWIEVRLGDEGIDNPGRSPLKQRVLDMAVPVAADAGLFFETVTRTGNSVTVSNKGVCPVWPRLRWKGAGGVFILPSGARFSLPAAPDERVM